MFIFTKDYCDGFKAGIKNKKFNKKYYTARGEELSAALVNPASTLFYDCVYLGYLDARRKFSGIGKISNLDKQACFQWLADELKKYFSGNVYKASKDFMKWHENTCNGFVAKFAKVGYGKVTIGMAQKVINLAFKYLHCCNYGTLNPDYFKYCHMALDDYTLRWYTRVVDSKNKIEKWSTIKDYSIYKKIQSNTESYLSKVFPGNIRESLLVNEFYVWPDEFIVEELIALRQAIEEYSNCDHKNSEIVNLYENLIDKSVSKSTIDDFIAHFK